MAKCGACGGKGYTTIKSKTGAQIPIKCLQCTGGQIPDPPKPKKK